MTGTRRADRTVIDFGAHLLPGASLTGSFADVEADEGPIYRDIDAAHERISAGGLDGAVLSWSRYIGSDEPDATASANDELLDIVGTRDGYYGLAALPSGAGGRPPPLSSNAVYGTGTAAVRSKRRAMEFRRPTTISNRCTNWPTERAPLLIHPKIHDSLGQAVLDETYHLNAIFGRGVALCSTACRMIHNGLLDRYPNVRPVFHHTAGNIASMLSRIRGN